MSMTFNGHALSCGCGNDNNFSINGADSSGGSADCLVCGATITIPGQS